jgi:hypothetical protein
MHRDNLDLRSLMEKGLNSKSSVLRYANLEVTYTTKSLTFHSIL